MSTGDLARTVIEGGRAGFNKYERRESSRTERVKAKSQLKRLADNPDDADDVVHVKREPVGAQFSDKLSPAYAWLESRVGKSWKKVSSELFAQFDTRTTAGRHIVFDHLLGSVSAPGIAKQSIGYYRNGREFFVDAQGVLRKNAGYRYSKKNAAKRRAAAEELREWVGTRRIAHRASEWAWMEPSRHGWVRCNCYGNAEIGALKHRMRVDGSPEHYVVLAYRRGDRLTHDEASRAGDLLVRCDFNLADVHRSNGLYPPDWRR